MNRRSAWIGTGAAVFIAGAALAATGRLPNPFDPPPPDVVDSGSEAAREAGEVTLPEPASASDPFAPALPIVESGTPEARDLAGEVIEEIPNPFELPPIEVVESGTDAAWIAHGEEITDLNEVKQLAMLRAWAEAAFVADSAFPRNPESELGVHRFDLRLRQLIDSAEGLGEITYFVNSADNSMYFPHWGLGSWLPSHQFDQGEFHFLLRQADGDTLVCGKHVDIGPACLQLGEELGAGFAWLRNMSLHQQFLRSVPRTPQTLGEGPGGAVQGLRGRGESGYLQFWVSRNAHPVATRMPWLGLGVGLMKDERVRANRLVRRMRAEGADSDGGDLVMDLIELDAARIEADTTPYRFVTAFTARGLEEAMALGQQGFDLKAQAIAIRQALDACPKGRPGRECRERERARMKALEDGFRDQALDFGRRHGLPVDD